MTKVNAEDITKEAGKEPAEEVEKAVEDIAKEDAAQAGEKDTQEEKKEAEKKETKEAEKASEEDADTRYLRLMADFQNYKKRVEKEKSDLYSYANEKIVTGLLDVLDNFERALAQEEIGDGFKEGMEMIFKQLSGELEKSGLAEIAALGEDFDPNFHNAVMTEETEEYESGKVSGVMQKGYTLNGKVIRPSMVKVVG